MSLLNKFHQTKDQVVAGVPYVAAGMLGFVPVDVPVAGLLGSVVGLKLFSDKMQQLYQNRHERYLKSLRVFDNDIVLNANNYEINTEIAYRNQVSQTIPFELSDETYNEIGDEVRFLFLDKIAKYNIEKNMTPLKAAYAALREVLDLEVPTYHKHQDVMYYVRQNNQQELLKLHQIASVYRCVQLAKDNETIINIYDQMRDFMYGETQPDRCLQFHQSETSRLINQTTRTSPMRAKIRDLFLATVSLTALAAGSMIYGMTTGNNQTKQTLFLGGLAAMTLGLTQMRGLKNVCQEVKRFAEPDFVGEISYHHAIQKQETKTIFSEKVERLTEAERMRCVKKYYREQMERFNQNPTEKLGAMLYHEWQEFQKTAMNKTAWYLLKQGHSIEDLMRLYGIRKVTNTMVQLNLLANIIKNFNVSSENFKTGIASHLYMIENRFSTIQREEREYIEADKRLFSSEQYPVLMIDRQIVMPYSLTIHPNVRQQLMQYREKE